MICFSDAAAVSFKAFLVEPFLIWEIFLSSEPVAAFETL